MSYLLNGTQSLSVLEAHYKTCHRQGEQRLERKESGLESGRIKKKEKIHT